MNGHSTKTAPLHWNFHHLKQILYSNFLKDCSPTKENLLPLLLLEGVFYRLEKFSFLLTTHKSHLAMITLLSGFWALFFSGLCRRLPSLRFLLSFLMPFIVPTHIPQYSGVLLYASQIVKIRLFSTASCLHKRSHDLLLHCGRFYHRLPFVRWSVCNKPQVKFMHSSTQT